MKKIKFRTKIELLLLVVLLMGIAISSVVGVTRTITDTSDTICTYIRNSNDKYWEVTEDNLRTAIWDLNDTGGTVWVGDNMSVAAPINTTDAGITLDFENHNLTLTSDCSALILQSDVTVRNLIIDASNVVISNSTSVISLDGSGVRTIAGVTVENVDIYGLNISSGPLG